MAGSRAWAVAGWRPWRVRARAGTPGRGRRSRGLRRGCIRLCRSASLFGERAALGGQVLDPLARFPDLLPRVRVSSSRWAWVSGLGFGGAQGRVVLAGVAAAEFGVGGDGQVPLGAGGGVPVGAVGHDGGEDVLALAVGVVQGLVAGGQLLLPAGLLVLAAALGGGSGFGGGADGGQAGLPGGGADLAELVADVLRRPGGLDGVGVAQVQQRPVGHAAHVGAVGGAEGGEGLVPGGAQVRGGGGGLGADRVGGVVVAGQFPPGADGAGALLPVQPVQRVAGDRAQGVDCPGQGVARRRARRSGPCARPSSRRSRRRRRGVRGRRWRGPARTTGPPGAGPGSRVRWRRRASRTAAGVAGSGQVPFGDRGGQDLPRRPGRPVRRRASSATAIWPGGLARGGSRAAGWPGAGPGSAARGRGRSRRSRWRSGWPGDRRRSGRGGGPGWRT